MKFKMENVLSDAPMEGIGKGPKRKLPRCFQTLDGLLDEQEEWVRRWWAMPERERGDSYSPMLVAVCKNGDVVPVMAGMSFNDESKAAFAREMRKAMKEWRVARYAFVAEAWMAGQEGKLDDPINQVRPADRQDRVEVMMITAADRHKVKGRMLRMVRDWESGKVTELARDERFEGLGGEVGGRFARLLMDDPDDEPKPGLDFETMRGLLLLEGADPDWFVDFEHVKEKGAQILQRIEAARDQIRKATTDFGQGLANEALILAAAEAKAFLIDLHRHSRKRKS